MHPSRSHQTGQIQHPESCECEVYSAPFGTECTSEVQTILFRTAPELGVGHGIRAKLKCYRSLQLIFRMFSILSVCVVAIAFD